MKCVGILGGYGPHATAHFFQTIIDATPAKKDWEHLHIIVNNNPQVPSRGRAFLYGEEDPTSRMLEEIERLRVSGADFFVCPCNSAHYFLHKVRDKFSLPFIDMVDTVVDYIVEHGFTRPLLIGSEVTMLSGMYQSAAAQKGIFIDNYPHPDIARSIIESGKLGKDIETSRNTLLEIIKQFTDTHDCLILGCTELPLIIQQEHTEFPLIDTTQILANKTTKYALE